MTGVDKRAGGTPAPASAPTDREALLRSLSSAGQAAVPPTLESIVGGGRAGGTPSSASAPTASRVFPQRKCPAHLPCIDRHNQPIILFVTVCARNRRRILDSERVHSALLNAWQRADQYRVGCYMMMPDHVHLFCSPAVHEAVNVKKWTAYWKRLVSVELKDLQPVWQRDCWDTQLRDALHYGEKWEYVVRNPVREGLVDDPASWRYQGCVNELRW